MHMEIMKDHSYRYRDSLRNTLNKKESSNINTTKKYPKPLSLSLSLSQRIMSKICRSFF